MAADGAGPTDPGAVGDARAHRAVDQLRATVADLEARLGAPASAALQPQSAEALARAVEALGRQLSRLEETSAARYGRVSGALKSLAARLDAEADARAGLEAQMGAQLEAALATLAAAAPRRHPAPIRLILSLANGAAAVAVMGAVATLLANPPAPRRLALIEAPAALALRPGLAEAGRAEVASPRQPVPPPPTRTAATEHPQGTYAEAVAALDRGEATALARLTGLATAGDTAAERYLAGLYEAGASGVARDPAAARAWTERAARGGDRLAMHNLALFLAQGEGGPADVAQAANWFHRAADRGVVDSQFNLGLMYEAGRGVERNLGEAYRWFAIAANAGDLAAREKQVDLQARLAAAERAGLDHEAAAFQPGSPTPTLAVVIPPATTVAETQALLARQGYFVGPVDGRTSPALRAATAAYLREHPAAPTH